MKQHESAFSLLEVIFALMIITTLSLALTTLLRGSFDIRESLGQNDKVSGRLGIAMAKIAYDIEHAYIIPEKNTARFGDFDKRKIRSTFEIQLGSGSDVLRMTTMSHVPLLKNSNESDTTFIVYKLEEDKETGRTNLMRGEAKRVPEDFKEDPPMRILAKEIKSFRISAWRGDEWNKEPWDSERRETKGLLPKLVQIQIEGYANEFNPETASSRTLSTADEPVLKYSTVVIIPSAQNMTELRPSPNTIRWDRL